MNIHALISVAALAGNVVLWAGVYWQRRRQPIDRAYMWLAAAVGLVLVGEILLHVELLEGWELINFRGFTLVWVPIGAIFLNFVYRLLGRRSDTLLHTAYVTSALGAGISAFTGLTISGFERYPWGVADLPGPFHVPAVLLSSIWATAGTVLVARRIFTTRDRAERGTLAVLLVGAVGSTVSASCFEMVIPDLLGITDFPRPAGTALAAFNLFVFIAYKRYGFLSLTPEQLAEDLFRESSEGMALVGRDGRVQRINPAGRALLGVGRKQSATAALGAIADPATLGSGETLPEVTAGQGEHKRILNLSVTAPARGGENIGKIVLIRDVTEQRRAEKILQRSHEELEQTVEQRTRELRQAQKMQAVGTLAGGIAHDFSNYLAAIRGFATAGRDDLPGKHPVREDFDEVLDAADKARELTEQILTFARRSSNLHRPVDAGIATRSALKLVEVSLPPDTRLTVRVDASPLWVNGDSTQLGQIVVNLCNNASQAIGSGGGSIHVAVQRVDVDEALAGSLSRLEPGSHVLIAVEDDGPGIQAEVLERIFEPYFTTRPEEKGTGLGLSTVFGIVQSHQGEIQVESESGKGTVMRVYLPARPEDETSPKTVDNRSRAERAGGKGARILVVDDDAQVLRMVCRVLDAEGYVTTPCDGGTHALESFDRDPDAVDGVITDLMMPELDGAELSRLLLERRPSLPIMIISGRADKLTNDPIEGIGVSAVLEKTAPNEALLRTLAGILADR